MAQRSVATVKLLDTATIIVIYRRYTAYAEKDTTKPPNLGPYEEGIYAAIKCSNCNGNHAANSLQCPRREEFRSVRETLSRKANNHLRRAANHINHEDHNAYPELSQPRHPSPYYDWNNHRKQPAPTPQTIPPRFKQPSPPPPPPQSSSQVQVQPSQSQANLPPAHHSTRSYNQHQNNPQQQQRKQQHKLIKIIRFSRHKNFYKSRTK